MGLDMFLTAKRYISGYFNKGDDERARIIQSVFPELTDIKGSWGKESSIKEVQAEVGYWRKANAIHRWFVDNVQDGRDECQSQPVTREQLTELRDICISVLDNRDLASELLPTASGFFFGSTDYEEHYFGDLEHTVKIINRCLELPDAWEFEYRSSW